MASLKPNTAVVNTWSKVCSKETTLPLDSSPIQNTAHHVCMHTGARSARRMFHVCTWVNTQSILSCTQRYTQATWKLPYRHRGPHGHTQLHMLQVLVRVDTQVHMSLCPHLDTVTYDPGLPLEEGTRFSKASTSPQERESSGK